MITDPAKQQQYLQQALNAGISQSEIDAFLQANPNDYHRIHNALRGGDGPGGPVSQSGTTAPGVDAGGGGGDASTSGYRPLGEIATFQGPSGGTGAASALGGLAGAGPSTYGAGSAGMYGGGQPQLSGTRLSLGQRMPPSLAGLLQVRAY